MLCQTNLADKMIPTLKDTYQKSTLMLAVLHQHNNETQWLPDILILSILASYFFSLCVFLGLQVPSLRFAALLEQSGGCLSDWRLLWLHHWAVKEEFYIFSLAVDGKQQLTIIVNRWFFQWLLTGFWTSEVLQGSFSTKPRETQVPKQRTWVMEIQLSILSIVNP